MGKRGVAPKGEDRDAAVFKREVCMKLRFRVTGVASRSTRSRVS